MSFSLLIQPRGKRQAESSQPHLTGVWKHCREALLSWATASFVLGEERFFCGLQHNLFLSHHLIVSPF